MSSSATQRAAWSGYGAARDSTRWLKPASSAWAMASPGGTGLIVGGPQDQGAGDRGGVAADLGADAVQHRAPGPGGAEVVAGHDGAREQGDKRYDARRMVGLLIAGLRQPGAARGR